MFALITGELSPNYAGNYKLANMYSINVNFDVVEKQENWNFDYEIRWFDDFQFDFRYPFREVIDKIINGLSQVFDEVELKIEPYDESEDFIEFSLILNGSVIGGYFEHSLCYLAFSHDDESTLERIRQIANDVQFDSKGYQGDLD